MNTLAEAFFKSRVKRTETTHVLRGDGQIKICGTVRFWDKRKGFGFVVPDEAGRDIYISAVEVQHNIKDEIKVGTRLAFFCRPPQPGRDLCSAYAVELAPSLTR